MSNSEDIVTHCPQCNTAFRVTLNQLAIASGQVRCGSCLAVFKAVDHNTKEQHTTTNTPEKNSTQAPLKDEFTAVSAVPIALTSSPPSPIEERAHTNDIHSLANGDQDTLISDEEVNHLDPDDNVFNIDSKSKHKKTHLFDRSLATAKEHKPESADESWAIKMLADLENEENQEKEQYTQFIINSETSIADNNLADIESKIEPSFDTDANTPSDFYDNHDDTGIQDNSKQDKTNLNIELEVDIEIYEPKTENSPPNFEDATTKELKHDNNEHPFDYALSDNNAIKETEESPSISDDDIENAIHARARYKDEASDYLANIEPAPVEMVQLSSPSAQRWLWRIGAILLGLLLVLQTALIRFDTLSKHPSYRSYYSVTCKVLGCTLPALIDTQKIRTTNLIVRSHPQRQHALIIDAILINNATFTQPFPALQLEFNDINNRLVAKRQLQPDEYLRGELAGATQMPNKQPIQLSIEIVDPGDNAVNYQLTVAQARGRQ